MPFSSETNSKFRVQDKKSFKWHRVRVQSCIKINKSISTNTDNFKISFCTIFGQESWNIFWDNVQIGYQGLVNFMPYKVKRPLSGQCGHSTPFSCIKQSIPCVTSGLSLSGHWTDSSLHRRKTCRTKWPCTKNMRYSFSK